VENTGEVHCFLNMKNNLPINIYLRLNPLSRGITYIVVNEGAESVSCRSNLLNYPANIP
jgi:hypothetical protein